MGRSLAFWREHLTVLELPARPAVQTHARARQAFAIPSVPMSAEALFAAFAVLLHRYTGQDKILAGESGRVLEVDLAGDPAFVEVIRRVRSVPSDDPSKLELVLDLTGTVDYDADLYDGAAIARFLRHFEMLAGADPHARISELPLLTDGERHQLLVEWNATARPLPEARIEALFEQQVLRTPDAIAVRFETAQLSYRELDARANQVAHRLRELGVGPDVLVPICVERSLEAVAGILGILKAGGAYVPLDPEYPPERLAFMLKDLAPRALVTQSRFVDRLPPGPWAVVGVDAVGDRPRDKPAPLGTPDDLAYGIFTSGTTGTPKCALIAHRGVVNLLLEETYKLDATDRILLKSALTFDASIPELFAPLCAGACMVVAKPDGHKDVRYLLDLIRAEQITLVMFVPSLLDLVVDDPALAACSSLRRVTVGGEALSVDLQARFFARCGAELHNMYGPTETTMYSTYWPCQRDSRDRSIPIGRAIANTQLYVLDARQQPVPIGVVGELSVGGVGVARGYLDRPELTTERFVPSPFTPGARLYRTGDLVRYRPDGALEYLGRTDHQAKIRGFRVELGEIEACLRAHAAVRDVVVVLRDQHLIAYVVGTHVPVDELRAQLRAQLPEYMIPSGFVVLDALPLSANGKVDRKALPAPALPARTVPLIAPRTAREEILARIWREVLGIEELGVTDDFFELGGHSLQAMQVVARVRDAVKVEVGVRAFFDAPTIEQLARAIDAGGETPADAIARVSGAAPLSSSQEQLWFLHALDKTSVAYNIPFALRLRGALDVDALARSITELVRRHEALRSTIAAAGGVPRMHVSPPAPHALHVEPVASVHEAETLAAAEVRRSFDLERGPLFRTRLLRLAAGDHILVITMHHIISDGWSCDVFQQELLATYAGLPVPEPAIRFADYAAWERARTLASATAYWREHVAGFPLVLELPTDRARPPVQSVAGAQARFVVGARTVEAIAKLCRTEGVTPFMALFAVFGVLLHRYTGQDRLLVGVPVANRARTETERVMGMFVNTLAFAADLSGDATFREVLQRVRVATVGGFAHQELPFNKLVEALQPARDLSRSPIVQAMFAYQTAAVRAPASAGGLTVSRMPLDTGTSKFELMLELEPRGTELAGTVEYSTDLFDRATIARFIEHFEVLVDALVADPDVRVGEAPLLTPAERRQLVAWNDTARAFPEHRIEELFEQQALRTPEAIAVSFEGAHLTYRELDARANQLAHRLRGIGVGPDVLVPIYIERSLEMLVGILAILKAGGAYVPLDPAYPPDRLAFMLGEIAPRVVITQARLAGALPPGAWEVLAAEAVLDEPRDRPRRSGTPDKLAYGIYTSGSTGTPKCALVTHRGVVSLLLEETYRLDATDRVLQKTPLTFDASVPELFGPLRVGARVVVARPDGHKDVRYLLDVIRAEQITSITFVPSLLDVFVNEPALADCSSLRRVLVGGEALSADVQARFFARSRAELHNTYGPTETTVTSAYWPCERGSTSVPIGRPVGNTQLHVLDARRQLVPIGVLGELYIGGVGLARGYLKRPELTDERFVPDPFRPGARLYRTGDVVRQRADGALEFLGRTDHQVKVRGFRVELGEIEACVRLHPGIREVVVVARDQHLIAYVVGDASTDELRALLRTKLPDYMVPSSFVVLDALPLMVNGKVDRKALPAPAWAARAERIAPRGVTEELLARIWCAVLGLDEVGAGDDFFELGGHSLLAMQVLSRIREATNVELSVRQFFDAPTIRDLARAIDAAHQAPAEVIPVLDRSVPAPLSSTQEQLWFLQALDPASAAYNLPFALRVRGALDVDALARSVDAIVRRHDVLRTTISVDVPQQRVAPDAPPALRAEPVENLCEAETLIAVEARRCFELERGPLLRTRLLRLGADDHVLVVTMHHIISDGWSCSVFEHELLEAYEAFASGNAWTAPPLAIQYTDYASWERARARSTALAYWQDHLAGAPDVLELPTDRTRPPVQTFTGAREAFVLSRPTLDAIATLGRTEAVTPFMALFAVFGVLLHRYTQQEKIVVGVPVANRTRTDTELLIGLFLNTLAFAADLSGQPTFREVLQRVRDATLAGFAHQELPFNKLVEALQPERDPSRTPIVQVMFVYQSATPEHAHQPTGLAVTRMPVETGTSKFELTLELEPSGAGAVEYNTDLFDRATIARFVEHFERLARALASDPGACISDAPLLTPAEAQQLRAWNDTQLAFPDERIEVLFERQVDRTPDAPAVRFEGAQLTYRELDARANQVAHRLRELGAGPGVLVPLHVERSLEMLAGILGILKAGGAYVPLDPEYPAERLAFMLQDCAPRVVVTHAAGGLPPGPWQVLGLDAALATPRDRPARAGTTADVAYGIYTSGSTGTPKCAQVIHRGVASLMTWMQATYALDATDRVLQKTPLIFDASIRELFWPLLHGACVVVARPDGHKDVGYLLDVIRAEHITTINFVPSLLEIFVEEPELVACSSLRRVLSGGEALSDQLRARFYARSGAKLYNHYGPTETTVTSAFWPCPRDNPDRSVPIGRPVANTQLHVLDARRQHVPIGVPGELYIGGVGLARGYLNRPALTDERFVPDPFTPGARLYRTGDVVRHRADGTLEYLGRTDHQIKIRGFRIELGEIEACLRAHPAIRDVVVVVREDAPGQKHLVAYVIGTAPLEELQQLIRTTLPEYMTPSAFVVLDAFPLMVNGKVDRKALPAPVRSATSTFVAPRNATEERIAQIWCVVLGLEQVSVTDEFFALGGHSLLAMQVAAKIRRAFDVAIPLRALLLAKTIEEQARQIAAAADAPAQDLGSFIRRDDTPIARATIGQEQFYYLSQDDPDPTAYFISNVFGIDGPLDRALLERSYCELVAHHSIFRTAFREIDGLLHQVILPELPVPPSLEFEVRANANEDDEIKRCVAELMTRPCDLPSGLGVIRARLVELAPARHLLVVLVHHIASDGAAFNTQLFEGYARLREGRASSLPDELPLQYIDFAHARARFAETAQGKVQRAYWEERARAAPPLEIPLDFPRGPLDARRDARPFGIAADLNYPPAYLPLPAAVREVVIRGAREQKTTPYMIYLGALAWLFHEASRQDDISIQTTISNRPEYPVLEQVQGPLAWWTHIRIDASGRPDFRELVRRTSAAVEGARRNGIVEDYFQLVHHGVRRSTFNYLPLSQISNEQQVADLAVVKKRQPFPKWKRFWDLHLTLQDFANDTVLVWTGTSPLYRQETVMALLQRYLDILARAAD